MDFVDQLRRTAADYRRRAADIRAQRADASATVSGVTITVGSNGRLHQVELSPESLSLSPARLSGAFQQAYQNALRAVTAGAAAAVVAELPDERLVEAAAHSGDDTTTRVASSSATSLDLDPEAQRSAGSYRAHDRQWVKTGRVDWPAGVADGPLEQVFAELKQRFQQVADRPSEHTDRVNSVVAVVEYPEARPTVRLEVALSGELRSTQFTAAASTKTPEQLADDVLAAAAQGVKAAKLEAQHILDEGLPQ